MRLKQRFAKGRYGGNVNKWSAVKKELNLSEEDLLLAKAKLELSELICDLRKSKKMSQKDLADAIGVSQPYIAKIEDGEENLTVETIVKLLSALHISLQLKPGKQKLHESVLRVAA